MHDPTQLRGDGWTRELTAAENSHRVTIGTPAARHRHCFINQHQADQLYETIKPVPQLGFAPFHS